MSFCPMNHRSRCRTIVGRCVVCPRTANFVTDIIYGCFLGTWNAMSAFMLVKAMKTLTGKVVFPFLSACGLMLSLLVAVGEVEKVAPALLDIIRRTLERVEDASHQL